MYVDSICMERKRPNIEEDCNYWLHNVVHHDKAIINTIAYTYVHMKNIYYILMHIKNSDKNNNVANVDESKLISNKHKRTYIGSHTICGVCMYV